jgi:hypothetical protein
MPENRCSCVSVNIGIGANRDDEYWSPFSSHIKAAIVNTTREEKE